MSYALLLGALGVAAVFVIALAVRSNLKQRKVAKEAKQPTNGIPKKSTLSSKQEVASRRAVEAMMTKYYEVVVSCGNCSQFTGMFLPRGTPITDITCPKCSVRGKLQSIPLGSLSQYDIDSLDIVYPEGLVESVSEAIPTTEAAKVSQGAPKRSSALFT